MIPRMRSLNDKIYGDNGMVKPAVPVKPVKKVKVAKKLGKKVKK